MGSDPEVQETVDTRGEGAKIDKLLKLAVEQRASDLHVAVGAPPVLRVDGELVVLEGTEPLQPETAAAMLDYIMGEAERSRFEGEGEVDFSYTLNGVGRFRINGFRQRGTVGIAVRVVPERVPTVEELGLPFVLQELALLDRGLLLVTGPTGSGKSTTLAALIDLINRRRKCHIITLEDPIEYLHPHKCSIVHQREIGGDTRNFPNALRAVLRQDPDVIMVGEMRDSESIGIALTAAETGHLVLASLHTIDAAHTVNRIVDVFPPHQQAQIRVQLAGSLQGIAVQRLVKRRDGTGRVPAFEVLVATPAVRNLIREGKTHQIPSALQTGARYGMITLEQSLRQLYEKGVIALDDYRLHSSAPEKISLR